MLQTQFYFHLFNNIVDDRAAPVMHERASQAVFKARLVQVRKIPTLTKPRLIDGTLIIRKKMTGHCINEQLTCHAFFYIFVFGDGYR